MIRMTNLKTSVQFEPKFMERAIELSQVAALIKKTGGPFGAVIVKDNQIISEGYNQVILKNDPTWHAEMDAIRQAGSVVGSPHLEGCVLYTSAEPCPMCLSASYWAHIDHIFYAATTGDALKYGNFDDINFLAEVQKEPQNRLIGICQHMRLEAVKIWKEYKQMKDKKHY